MRTMPIEIAAADPQVLRPADLDDVYAQPAKEFLRLARGGVLLRLAHGYYAVVPEPLRGTAWRPAVEDVGLAVGQHDYGRDDTVLMGVTAARLLGAVPRALGTAVVAVPRQRPALETAVGRIHFVTRAVERLDVRRVETGLATGWVTTPEQTVLDLADRPGLGALPYGEVLEAMRYLGAGLDWHLLRELAIAQRKRPAALRAAAALDVDPPFDDERATGGPRPTIAGSSGC